MRELGIYVDESGEQEGSSKYYLLTLVFLDHSAEIKSIKQRYFQALQLKQLPNIPFHASPLMNGHDDYSDLTLECRKRLLNTFNVFSQNLPVKYATFAYRRKEVASLEALGKAMRKDVTSFLYEKLATLQQYGCVKIHYDGGQKIVADVLRDVSTRVFATGTVDFQKEDFKKQIILQVADYFCAIELARLKFERHEETSTDIKIFGYVGTFKNNFLKQAKRKKLA